MNAASSAWRRILAWADDVGPLEGIALLRCIAGVMLLRSTMHSFEIHRQLGYFGARFHVPYFSWHDPPPERVFEALLLALAILGVSISLGLFTRASLLLGGAASLHILLLNQLWFSNNRYYLVLALVLLFLSPAGRAWSLDARWRNRPPTGPTWAVGLLKLQITLVYLASGLSKFADGAWRTGRVLVGKAPEWMDLTYEGARPLWHALATTSICFEIFLGVGLWHPRTRRAAAWIGLLFHATIELTLEVRTFSWMALGTFFLFASPARHDRTFEYPPSRRWVASLARRLDWLGKIRFSEREGGSFHFRDRDGAEGMELPAIAALGSSLPLAFGLAYPLTVMGRAFGIRSNAAFAVLTATMVAAALGAGTTILIAFEVPWERLRWTLLALGALLFATRIAPREERPA